MARITIEDCLEHINDHFKLVLVASHRARQLQAGAVPKIDAGNEKSSIIALREIAQGLINEDILNEPLVQDTRAAEEELAELLAKDLLTQDDVTLELDDLIEDEEGAKVTADTADTSADEETGDTPEIKLSKSELALAKAFSEEYAAETQTKPGDSESNEETEKDRADTEKPA